MLESLSVLLAEPRGFCAGVDRAIAIVEKALEMYGTPIYVRHEIVHNAFVVNDLKSKGAVFVKELSEIPDGGIAVFSAHGVSEKVEDEARLRALPVIDATCPLVTKVHNQAKRYEREGYCILLIGHEGHPEVEGTSGRVQQEVQVVGSVAEAAQVQPSQTQKLTYVTQTTLSVDDTQDIINILKERFPTLEGPGVDDICYATQNRQQAVRDMIPHIDVLLVIGATNSSNSNRLRDIGQECGVPSHLISSAKDIQPKWFANNQRIGLSAGASAPEILVEQVITHLHSLAKALHVKHWDGITEDIHFNLPREVRSPILKSA